MKRFFQYLKRLYDRYKLHKTEKEFNRALDEEINWINQPKDFMDVSYLEEQTVKRYEQALLMLKKKVKELVQSNNKEDYDRALKRVENLICLTHKEDHSPHLEVLKNLYVYKEADIKSKEDKMEMIHRRISDYYQLQENKVKREMSRKIRKLEQEGKIEEAKELTKEWKKRYT